MFKLLFLAISFISISAFAKENWIILGTKNNGIFYLDTASKVKNENIRMDSDIEESQVKVVLDYKNLGYNEIDSTFLFDCTEQLYGSGEDIYKLDGKIVYHVMHDDINFMKFSSQVLIAAWVNICNKKYDQKKGPSNGYSIDKKDAI